MGTGSAEWARLRGGLRLLALGLALGLGRPAAAGDPESKPFKLVVGSWCPFECTAADAGGARGFLTDIAVAVLGAQGIRTVLVDASYRRGIELVMENRAQVLIGIPKEDAPDLIYPDVEQGLSSNTFFVRAGDPWRYRNLGSLEQRRAVGIVKEFDYDELDALIASRPQLFSTIPAIYNDHLSNAQRNIEKLLAGRIDTIVHDEFVTEFQLKKMNRVGDIVPAGSLRRLQPLYVAFSPRLPDARRHAEQMARGTEALRARGELARILDRYGLRDWRAPH